MTGKQKFISALKHEPITGNVPHFEMVFFPTMEALGKVHPVHRTFGQWAQMSEKERELHRTDIAQTYIDIARKYEHSAIFPQFYIGDTEETIRLLTKIRELSGDEYFIMLHGDGTYEIPDGEKMLEFSYRLVDDEEGVKAEADARVNNLVSLFEKIVTHNKDLIDGVALCADYCLNQGPFLSPNQFSEFVTPYLAKEIKLYRDLGLYSMKHTDGNIMPIIDQMIECKPDALHSLDPQAGVDIAVIKNLYGNKVCLIGNVNCGLLQTGTLEEVEQSVMYALENGMPGGGYVFSSSNCVYPGLALERYEFMWDLWKTRGIYK